VTIAWEVAEESSSVKPG